MAMIVYGWGEIFSKRKIMGYGYCDRCQNFEQYYLSRLVFRVHIAYIPIFWLPKGYYISCKGCKFGKQITKEEYKRYKQEYKQMTKSIAKQSYKQISTLCENIGEFSQANVDYIMQQICGLFPAISSSEVIKKHYYMLISDTLSGVHNRLHPAPAPVPTAAQQTLPSNSQKMAALMAANAASAQTTEAPAIPPAVTPQGAQTSPNVWICSNCGKENSAKFCSGCGSPKPEQQAAPQPTQRVTVCPRCSKQDANAPLFCSACGAPMNVKR